MAGPTGELAQTVTWGSVRGRFGCQVSYWESVASFDARLVRHATVQVMRDESVEPLWCL